MSKARFCDRCGIRIDGKHKFIDLKPAHYILGMETIMFDYWEGEYISRLEYDLCKTCAADLERFMRGQSTDEVKEE